MLWRVVTSRSGLPLTVTTNHYAWTYGPTAILVDLVSIWRQVDYHCKATQPWREMVTGYPASDRSILLDYISSMQILDVYKSLRFRHYPVALTATGFIIKFTILVSTTVLVLKPTSRLETSPIQYAASFNTQDLWDKLSRNDSTWSPTHILHTYYFGNHTFLDDVVMEYSQELYGRPADATRITNNMVFQPFSSPLEIDVTFVTAAVDVFAPLISCEIAQVSLVPDKRYDTNLRLGLEADSCSSGKNGTTDYVTPKSNDLRFVSSFIYCGGVQGDGRILVAFLLSNSSTANNSSDIRLLKSSATICKVDFKMHVADAIRRDSDNRVELTNLVAGHSIDLNSSELARIIYTGLNHGNDALSSMDLPGEVDGDGGNWKTT